MRIIIFSWHFLGVYSALWGLATGAFPSSVQIGELEGLLVFTHGHSDLTHYTEYLRIVAHSGHQGNVDHPKSQIKQMTSIKSAEIQAGMTERGRRDTGFFSGASFPSCFFNPRWIALMGEWCIFSAVTHGFRNAHQLFHSISPFICVYFKGCSRLMNASASFAPFLSSSLLPQYSLSLPLAPPPIFLSVLHTHSHTPTGMCVIMNALHHSFWGATGRSSIEIRLLDSVSSQLPINFTG